MHRIYMLSIALIFALMTVALFVPVGAVFANGPIADTEDRPGEARQTAPGAEQEEIYEEDEIEEEGLEQEIDEPLPEDSERTPDQPGRARQTAPTAVPEEMEEDDVTQPAAPGAEPEVIPPTPGMERPAVPADIGAGPAPRLMDFTGEEFDEAFMEAMYQHHNDLAALATLGMQRANDPRLRQLSGKIYREQVDLNQKLVEWYPQFTNQPVSALDFTYERPEYEIDQLQMLTGDQFDIQYAQALVNHLQQSRNAAELAMVRSTIPQLRDQAEIVARATQNEITALNRWLNQQTVTDTEVLQ